MHISSIEENPDYGPDLELLSPSRPNYGPTKLEISVGTMTWNLNSHLQINPIGQQELQLLSASHSF